MRKAGSLFLTALLVVLIVGAVSAQTTEFTYQGSLKDGATAANGNHDFEFALFDAVSGGTQLGATQTQKGIAVTNGIFAVKLDFGDQFPGANRYLEIRVRVSGGGTLTLLSPRQIVNSRAFRIPPSSPARGPGATTARYGERKTTEGPLPSHRA